MGVQFCIEGQDVDPWSCDFTNRNARIVAAIIGLNLDPEGFGVYGELQPADCVTYMTAIEQALTKDLSEYVVDSSDTRQPVGPGKVNGNVTHLQYGVRVTNQGINEQGIKDRLTALYLLFHRAVEVNSPVVWA